jgi:hypothetical protein
MEKKENVLSNKLWQKLFLFINRDETRKQIQMFLVDPLLNHVMERILPYILLSCVFLVILLLLVMLTLGIVLFHFRNVTPNASIQLSST